LKSSGNPAFLERALNRFGRLHAIISDSAIFEPTSDDGDAEYERHLQEYARKYQKRSYLGYSFVRWIDDLQPSRD
jgi:hypothetical protein